MSVPDFVIIGAMRAGTTTLHHVLGAHPAVFIPDAENFVLDDDDFEEHAEAWRTADGWRVPDPDPSPDALAARWAATFAGARPGQRLGLDATTWLTSARTPARLAALNPAARIVVILRDPVARLWSHYWHLVGSGRATLPLDEALLSARGTLLKRSGYLAGLRRWSAAFPREQLHVLVLEEYARAPQAHVDALCAFLGLAGTVDLSALPADTMHRHRARSPRHPRLMLAGNWLVRSGWPRLGRLLRRLARPRAVDGYPPLPPALRPVLEALLRAENAGLERELGRAPGSLWPWLA